MRIAVLTSESLDYLLHWLDSDPERAGGRYELLRRRLIEFFSRRGCAIADELADRTLDRVANRLAGGEVILSEQSHVYPLGVARYVLLEYLRSQEAKKKVSLESGLPGGGELSDERSRMKEKEESEKERRLACLDRCLKQLPAKERGLIQKYYEADWKSQVESRGQMAERLGLAPTGLRTRAHRIRRKLEQCVAGCMKDATD